MNSRGPDFLQRSSHRRQRATENLSSAYPGGHMQAHIYSSALPLASGTSNKGLPPCEAQGPRRFSHRVLLDFWRQPERSPHLDAYPSLVVTLGRVVSRIAYRVSEIFQTWTEAPWKLLSLEPLAHETNFEIHNIISALPPGIEAK